VEQRATPAVESSGSYATDIFQFDEGYASHVYQQPRRRHDSDSVYSELRYLLGHSLDAGSSTVVDHSEADPIPLPSMSGPGPSLPERSRFDASCAPPLASQDFNPNNPSRQRTDSDANPTKALFGARATRRNLGATGLLVAPQFLNPGPTGHQPNCGAINRLLVSPVVSGTDQSCSAASTLPLELPLSRGLIQDLDGRVSDEKQVQDVIDTLDRVGTI
jgi:hypothetical protein